jgi:hypothetical protein
MKCADLQLWVCQFLPDEKTQRQANHHRLRTAAIAYALYDSFSLAITMQLGVEGLSAAMTS